MTDLNNNFIYQLPVPVLASVPGRIACEVKTVQTIQKKRIAGMDVVDTKQSLAELAVLFPTSVGAKLALKEGDKIYLYAGALNQPFGSEHFDLDGKTFILVPEDQVVMIRSTPTPYPFVLTQTNF